MCTSPLALSTVVGFLDSCNVSNSHELNSFLLIICIDAPELTANSRSSGLFEVGAGITLASKGVLSVFVEARCWEKRNSDVALREIHQEFESQRFQLQQASRWVDQAQRDKISSYGELEFRSRPFQENHARDCQEIEELRRICCEETNRATQARIGDLSMHQERSPTTVSQLLTQIQELQNKVSALSDAREFYDPESGSSSVATPRFCIAAWYSEYYWCIRKRFWTTICSRRTILYNFQQFKEFGDLILKELQRDRRVKWKESRWIRQSLYHITQEEVACWTILVKLILTVVWLIIRDFQFRNCIWEHFLTPWNFKAGKSTSRLKCLFENSRSSHLTVQRIKEVQMAKSIGWGANRFPRLRYSWFDDCVCIKKTSRQAHSLSLESVEEQRAQNPDRPPRGRQKCLHDLRAFPRHRRLWGGTRTLRLVQYTFTEW